MDLQFLTELPFFRPYLFKTFKRRQILVNLLPTFIIIIWQQHQVLSCQLPTTMITKSKKYNGFKSKLKSWELPMWMDDYGVNVEDHPEIIPVLSEESDDANTSNNMFWRLWHYSRNMFFLLFFSNNALPKFKSVMMMKRADNFLFLDSLFSNTPQKYFYNESFVQIFLISPGTCLVHVIV